MLQIILEKERSDRGNPPAGLGDCRAEAHRLAMTAPIF